MAFGKIKDERRAYYGYGVVHEEGGEKAHYEKDEQDEGVDGARPPEEPVGKVVQIPAFDHRLPHDQHSQQKKQLSHN